jgi:inorganic pyrophosphatase
MTDEGKEDDKILAVPVGEPSFDGIHNYTQIFPHLIRKISHFFETYKLLEGKRTATQGWQDAAAARQIVKESYERFMQVQAAEPAT